MTSLTLRRKNNCLLNFKKKQLEKVRDRMVRDNMMIYKVVVFRKVRKNMMIFMVAMINKMRDNMVVFMMARDMMMMCMIGWTLIRVMHVWWMRVAL